MIRRNIFTFSLTLLVGIAILANFCEPEIVTTDETVAVVWRTPRFHSLTLHACPVRCVYFEDAQ